jgi:hypothetical protein
VSDIHDYQYPHDDADVIEIKQAMDSTSIALVPVVDLTRVAANMARARGVDQCRGGTDGVATNVAAPPSSGSQALALMMMFDLDRETL